LAADDERRLRAFSAQAAIAIENAQLFEAVSTERNYNEAILHSMNNAVLTLDADGILRKANECRAPASCSRSDPETSSVATRSKNSSSATQCLGRQQPGKGPQPRASTDITVDTDLLVEGSARRSR
jgi:hypothetical protein